MWYDYIYTHVVYTHTVRSDGGGERLLLEEGVNGPDNQTAVGVNGPDDQKNAVGVLEEERLVEKTVSSSYYYDDDFD